jgi:sugar/nucleoside kinase (ribokinase family)
MNQHKKGIACGGQWIIDRVKCIDHYPREFSVAMISDEKWSGGGCSYNVIKNLALFDPSLPLIAVGLIGRDTDGDRILKDLEQYKNISTRFLKKTDKATSYTDVYSIRETGSRTFFHFPGANALFSVNSVEARQLNARIFHLGYLGILDAMDAPDEAFGSQSARFLNDLKTLGIQTSVDLITTDRPDFCRIVEPVLKFTDYLIINELEAGQLTSVPVRKHRRIDKGRLLKNAETIFQKGLNELLIIHFPEGAFLQARSGATLYQPALQLPKEFIIGSTGAGDSFCSAVLYGLYQKWTLEETLRFAVCAGAQNLHDLTSTGAITSWQEIFTLYEKYPKQESVFKGRVE